MVERDLARACVWLLLLCVRAYQNKDCGPNRRIAISLFVGVILRVGRNYLKVRPTPHMADASMDPLRILSNQIFESCHPRF